MSVEPPSDRHRRLDVQGLRAIAVLFVVLFHADLPFPGGFVGVDVFFVISGFVITAMLGREIERTGRVRFGHFYARRFRRLTPALALMAACTVVVSALLQSPLQSQDNVAETAIGAMLLVANVAIDNTTGGYFDVAATTNPLLHTWSLSVEEQFYLVFPLLLAFGWRLTRRRTEFASGRLVLTLIVAAASFALAVAASRGWAIPVPDLGFYSPFTRAWEFAAGALVALVGARFALGRAGATAAGLSGAAMLLVSLWFITEDTPFPGSTTLLPVVGTVLLIQAGMTPENPVSRLLATRPFVTTGDLSYSIYLWHWPTIVFALVLWPGSTAAATVAAVVSLLPAIAAYRWVEQPIRNLRTIGPRRMAAIVVPTLLTPILLAVGLKAAAENGFWSDPVRELQAAVKPLHAAAVRGCTVGRVQDERSAVACTWNSEASGRPLYLIGDSNADQFSEAVIGAAKQLGRPATLNTFNGCALLGASWSDRDDTAQQSCRGWVDGTLGWLTGSAPKGDVVIGMSDSLWLSGSSAVGPSRAEETAEPAAKDAYLEKDLRDVVRRLRDSGQRVLLLQPVFKPWKIVDGQIEGLAEPERCSTLAVLRSRCPRPVVRSQAYADRLQARPRATIAAVARATGAETLDFRAQLCPARRCSTQRGDRLLYRDAGHISTTTSRELTPAFVAALR